MLGSRADIAELPSQERRAATAQRIPCLTAGSRRQRFALSGRLVQLLTLLCAAGLALVGAFDPFNLIPPGCVDQWANCTALAAQGRCNGQSTYGGRSVRDFYCAKTCHGMPCYTGCVDLLDADECKLSRRQRDCDTGATRNGLSVRDVWCAKTCGGETCNKGPDWCHDWIGNTLCEFLMVYLNVCDPKYVINGLTIRDMWCAKTCKGMPCITGLPVAQPPPPELDATPPDERPTEPPVPPPLAPSTPPPAPPPPLPATGGAVMVGPICDNDLPVSLQCPVGMVISAITQAFWGRSDGTTCPSTAAAMANTTCRSDDFEAVMNRLCVGLDECFVHVREQVQNPCPGTYKWMSLTFHCSPAPPEPAPTPPTAATGDLGLPPPPEPASSDPGSQEGVRTLGPICEADVMPIIMLCPPRMVISTIHQAFNGRSDNTTCPFDKNIVADATSGTNCLVTDFPGYVQSRCLGMRGCSVMANTLHITKPDNCADTYRWVFLSWNCSYRAPGVFSLAAIPPPLPPSPASDLEACSVCPGCDYGAPGSALRVLRELPDRGACCRACSEDPACSFWVFHSVSGECQLKSDQGADPGFFRAPNDDLVAGGKKRPSELGAASAAPWALFSTGYVFPYDDRYDKWIWSSSHPAGASWSISPVFSTQVDGLNISTPALLYVVADDRAHIYLNGHFVATVDGVGQNGANNHVGINVVNPPVALTLQPGRNLLSLWCVNKRDFVTDTPDVKSSAGVMAVLMLRDNRTVLRRTDQSWVMATRLVQETVCPQQPGFTVTFDHTHSGGALSGLVHDPAGICQARSDCAGFSTGFGGDHTQGVLTTDGTAVTGKPGFCFYMKMSDDDPPVRGMLAPCGRVGVTSDMALNRVPTPLKWYARGPIDAVFRLRYQFPDGRMSNGRDAMLLQCQHYNWRVPQLYVEFSRSFSVGDGVAIVLEQRNFSSPCPNKWVAVRRYYTCGGDTLCRFLFQDGVPPATCPSSTAITAAAVASGTASAGLASASTPPAAAAKARDMKEWNVTGANLPDAATLVSSSSPSDVPETTSPAWSHSCQVVMRGTDRNAPDFVAPSLRCWPNPNYYADGRGANVTAAPVNVSIGGVLSAYLQPNTSLPIGYTVLSSTRTAAANATNTTWATEDWGITFHGVPHLRLVNSLVSELPLSPVGPLLHCSGCSGLTLHNVLIERLSGVPRPSPRAAPPVMVYGALQASGLYAAGVTVVNSTCANVQNAHGWACLRFIYATGDNASASAISTAAAGLPIRLTVSGSRFQRNTVVAPGVLRGLCVANGTEHGLGAIVLEAAGPGGDAVQVTAGDTSSTPAGNSILQIDGSVMDSNTGGCGSAVSVINVGVPIVWTNSLASGNRATARGAVAFLGGSPNNSAAGVLDIQVAGGSRLAGNRAVYGGVAYAARHVRAFRVQENSNVTDNTAEYDGGALCSNGSISVFEVSDDSLLSDNAAGFSGGATFAFGSISNLTIRNGSRLLANRALYGGAAYAYVDITAMSLSGCSQLASNAARFGGAAYAASCLHLLDVAEGSAVDGNTAELRGGAFAAGSCLGNVTIRQSRIARNNAGDGGAFYARSYVTSLRLLQSTLVTDNQAANGGLLYTAGFAGDLEVASGSSVVNNSATNAAGVFCVNGTVGGLSITGNGVLSSNRAAQGGVLFANSSILAIGMSDNASASYNNASYGGVAFVNGAIEQLTVSGGTTLAGNTAAIHGGVVFTKSSLGAVLISGNSSFAQNTAEVDGGAIFVAGNVRSLGIVDQSSMSDNRAATGSGGAVFCGGSLFSLSVGAGSSVAGNSALLSGGAMHAEDSVGSVRLFQNSSLSVNSAQQAGGAIWAGSYVTEVQLEAGSRAEGNSAPYGGVLYSQGRILALTITGSSAFSNNTASHGGGVYAAAGIGNITVATNSTLAGNYAGTYGGGVYAGENVGHVLVTEGAAVAGNRAGGRGSCGGAIYAAGNVTSIAVLLNSTLTANSAEAAGGAIYAGSNLDNVRLHSGSSVSGNTAQSGGAIYAARTVLNITLASQSRFEDNQAVADGGAVYAGTAIWQVQLINGSGLRSNRAGERGGAFFTPGLIWQLQLEGGSEAAFNAAQLGGAVYAKVLNVGLRSSYVVGNSAGVDGGAFYVLADTPTWWSASDTSFAGNTASRHGGAVCITGTQPQQLGSGSAASSSMVLTGSAFINNSALGYGGAIAVASAVSVQLRDGSFWGNAASSGGALAVWDAQSPAGGGVLPQKSEPVANCSGSGFNENVATAGSGGAVFVASHSSFLCANCTFAANSASDSGGAVAADGCSSVGLVASSFMANSAAGYGGALSSKGCATAVVAYSQLTNNTATLGGGLAFAPAGTLQSSNVPIRSAVLVSATSINGNQATRNLSQGVSAYGGGVYIADGVELALLHDTSFADNRAWLGRDVASTQACLHHLPADSPILLNMVASQAASAPDWWRAWTSVVPYVQSTVAASRLGIATGTASVTTAQRSGSICSTLILLGVAFLDGSSNGSAAVPPSQPDLSTDAVAVTSASATAGPSSMSTYSGAGDASSDLLANASLACTADHQSCSGSAVGGEAIPVWLGDQSLSSIYVGCPVHLPAVVRPSSASLQDALVSVCRVSEPSNLAWIETPPARAVLRAPNACYLTTEEPLRNSSSQPCQPLVIKTRSPLAFSVGLQTVDGKPVSSVPLSGAYSVKLSLATASLASMVAATASCTGCDASFAVTNASTGSTYLCFPGVEQCSRPMAAVEVSSVAEVKVNDTTGVAHWDSLIVSGWPGNYTLVAAVNGPRQVPSLYIPVQLVGCTIGETLDLPGESLPELLIANCSQCPRRQVGLAPDPRTPLSDGASAAQPRVDPLKPVSEYALEAAAACHACPSLAVCPGGPVIAPLPGHWHSSPNSIQIHRCPNQLACTASYSMLVVAANSSLAYPPSLNSTLQLLGAADSRTMYLALCQASTYNVLGANQLDSASQWAAHLPGAGACLLTGVPYNSPRAYVQQQCSDGYTGNLCAACQPGFSRDDSFECSECPARVGRTIGLGLLAFFANVALILYVAATNMATTGESGPEPGDILKVIVTHAQYLIIISRLNIQVPSVLSSFVGALSIFTGADNYIAFSYACLLPDQDSAGQAHLQVLGALFTPCAVIAVSLLFWSSHRLPSVCKWSELKAAARRMASASRPSGGTAKAQPAKGTSATGDSATPKKDTPQAHIDAADAPAPAANQYLNPFAAPLTSLDSVPSVRIVQARSTPGITSAGSLMGALSTKLSRAILPSQDIKLASQVLSLAQQLGLVSMVASFVLYPTWAQAAFSIFSCYTIDREDGASVVQAAHPYGYWIRNMVQECYTGVHMHLYVPLGVAALLVFCVAPPLVATCLLWRRRANLHTPDTQRRFGFLYRRYRPRWFWWDLMTQVQTLALVAVNVFGKGIPVLYQALMLLIVLIAIATVNILVAPVKHALLQRLEFASLAVLSMSVSLSLYFVNDDPDIIDGDVGIVLSVLLIGINAAIVLGFLTIVLKRILLPANEWLNLRSRSRQQAPAAAPKAAAAAAGPSSSTPAASTPERRAVDWEGPRSPFAAALDDDSDDTSERSFAVQEGPGLPDPVGSQALSALPSLPAQLSGARARSSHAGSQAAAAKVREVNVADLIPGLGTQHGVCMEGAIIVDLSSE